MTPYQAYDKARALGKRIPSFEPFISQDAHSSYLYAFFVIKDRWELGEAIISKNSYISYLYSFHVIKGRWELGEPAISQNAFDSYHYALDVIKGRLPDFMHNQMILNNNNRYTKEYVKFIK